MRPRSARPRSARTGRPSPHAAGALVSTATRAFAPSKVRAMFFSRLSWLSRLLRRASTDSAASRALHVTSDGTSTAPRTWAPCDWLTRMAYLRRWAGRRRGLQGSPREVASWSGCRGEWVSGSGRGPHWEAAPGPLLARLGLRSALCSRALSQHRAPPPSGLRLLALKSWPQATRRLAWIGRQKRTVKTNLSFPPAFSELSRTFRCFELCN